MVSLIRNRKLEDVDLVAAPSKKTKSEPVAVPYLEEMAIRLIASPKPVYTPCKLLGVHSTSEPISHFPIPKQKLLQTDQPVSYLTSEIYRQYISLFPNPDYKKFVLSNEALSHPAISEVVFPILFNRCFIIRPPTADEALDIEEHHIGEDFADYQKIANAFGKFTVKNKNHQLFFIEYLNDPKRHKFGLLHFYTEENKCVIESIRIIEEAKKLGLGAALMRLAYTYAKESKCSKIELLSVEESDRFYVSLGFAPLKAPYDEWDKLTLVQKFKFKEEHRKQFSYLFEIPLTHNKAIQIFESKTERALRGDYAPKRLTPVDLSKIRIPMFAFGWNLLGDKELNIFDWDSVDPSQYIGTLKQN